MTAKVGDRSQLVNLHVAEYTALTNRVTYWITLQFSVVATGLAAIASLLLVMASWPGAPRPAFSWAAVLVAEATVGSYLYTMFEMMNTSWYVHDELLAAVQDVIPGARIWLWEVVKARHAVFSPNGVYLMLIWAGSPIVLIFALFRPANWQEGVLCAGAVTLLAWNVKLCRDVSYAHSRLLRAARRHSKAGEQKHTSPGAREPRP